MTKEISPRELNYLTAHSIAVYDSELRPDLFDNLAACAEAAILYDSSDTQVQELGYDTMDKLQFAATDDPELLFLYARILNYADATDTEGRYALLNSYLRLGLQYSPLPPIEDSQGFDQPQDPGFKLGDACRKVISRITSGTKELVKMLEMEEPEYELEPVEPYTDGYPEVDPNELKLEELATRADRHLSIVNWMGRLVGLRSLTPEQNAELLNWHQSRRANMIVKHFNGEDIGRSRLAQMIINSQLSREEARTIVPDLDQRIERRRKTSEDIQRFMERKRQQDSKGITHAIS